MEEIRSSIRGRVQLVMFRDFAQRKARALGLSGFVRNLADGSVEVVAQGERGALERFIEKLHRGSLFARVDEVLVEWRTAQKQFDSFEIVF